jgi:hypothetical protein
MPPYRTRVPGVPVRRFGNEPSRPVNFDVPVDVELYRKAAGDAQYDRKSFLDLKPSDPDYKLRLFEIMAYNMEILGSMRIIGRGVTTRSISITNQPTRIMQTSSPQGITIINPTPTIGLTSSFALYPAGTLFNATGNSQLTPIGVANYDSMHLFITVTGVGGGGNINVIAQAKDELTGAWVDVQDIVPAGITAAGTYYGFFSGLGIASNFALRWTDNGGGGSMTASIGYTLKNGLGGTSSGTANTVYIGGNGVSQYSGYPILEGQFRDFNLRENVDLFGVTGGGIVSINLIEFS